MRFTRWFRRPSEVAFMERVIITLPFAIKQLDAARAAGLQESARTAFAFLGSSLVAEVLGTAPAPYAAPHLHAYAINRDAQEVRDRLCAEGIEVWVHPWEGQAMLRVSGWLHNTASQYEVLAHMLRRFAVRAAP